MRNQAYPAGRRSRSTGLYRFELDFMRHLAEKEAEAWPSNNLEEVMKITKSEQVFLDEHVLRWIPRFCDLMFDQAELDFYRGIARSRKVLCRAMPTP